MKTLVKKIFVLSLFVGTLAFSACSSEEITPANPNSNRAEADTCRRN